MTRINTTFTQLQHRKALIPYITAGDPTPAITVKLMHALREAGADIIELGMPFSDPTADGPVIERAHQRALKQGMSLLKTFECVRQFREQDQTTPVVLMGYLNPIEIMGYNPFIHQAKTAGVDGVLVVDLPIEENNDLFIKLKANSIEPIFLLTPTTSLDRLKRICEQASGFLYYVSLKGVTGAATLDINDVALKLAPVRACSKLPIVVGFGIRDAASAAAIVKTADGIVVGSALVAIIEKEYSQPSALISKATEFLSDISKAIR